ncbi:putative exocyst complex component Exo70, cullin repeat-like-containing domain-containing protein [Lupinus albus]|uniref:Exocyst subunit Exo70 family protein n=1 Tax=Lupinus albus TaxID=3870 RepID=A0A6A4PIK9_LUPAL|nr:putative exocyst complex component Exo70, cullin repeat-like-containing domain-containing protein [Lupinus albus]
MTTTTSITGGGGGEDRVLATAQQIMKSLNTPKDVREDMLLIFSTFDNRLSGISDLINGEESNNKNEEDLQRFQAAEKVILRWDPSFSTEPSRHFNSLLDSKNDAVDYFSALDEIIDFMEQLSVAPPPSCDGKSGQVMVERAENAIQLAMSRLEDELRHVLIRNTVPLNAERLRGSMKKVSLSFASHIDENLESFGDHEIGDRGYDRFHSRGASLDDEVIVDLVNPDAVLQLREIVERMVRSGYERECLQVYSSVRRDALDESLVILGVERLSIEEVQRIEWESLDEKMKNWVHAVKIAVRVLLCGEKRLCDSVFSDLDENYLMKKICFNETAKGCVLQLLNFGEAVTICKRSPEKLFRILDMYEALRNALPDLGALVLDELVIGEVRGVLSGLGEAAKGTFAEFENCIRNETSKKLVITGDVHPLPRYVMNYLKLLVDYGELLNLLLQTNDEDLHRFQNDFGGDSSQFESMSPLGRRVLLLMSQLESNLGEKSRLYEDNAMQHVFLMNNLHYLVRKVKDSDLGKVLGDDWIRKRRGQIRQCATGYLRASWSKALSCLKDDGIGGSSRSSSKMTLKDKFKNFNSCFEEIYRIQTGWKVPEEQLREELRISISEKVIPAYRSFHGRFSTQLDGRHAGRYVKYTPDSLEIYLLDLFEGNPAVLNHMKRKST